VKYDLLIEKILKYFTSEKYADEVKLAKREFFEQAGILDDDSSHFELRMAQFLDWYLFTRELRNEHITPINWITELTDMDLNQQELAAVENLNRCVHSLFEFSKIRGSDVYIEDLFNKKKLIVRNSTLTAGFNSDEIFEARVIPFENSWVFCKGFCFHPPESKKFILAEVKKVRHLDRQQQEDLILRLFKMRYKFEQYKHIRLEYIYTNDSKLRI
jgi:hypothetical protein